MCGKEAQGQEAGGPGRDVEARAEREFQARYDDHQNAMFVRLGMSEYYIRLSEGGGL